MSTKADVADGIVAVVALANLGALIGRAWQGHTALLVSALLGCAVAGYMLRYFIGGRR